jgi:hypothetical protein
LQFFQLLLGNLCSLELFLKAVVLVLRVTEVRMRVLKAFRAPVSSPFSIRIDRVVGSLQCFSFRVTRMPLGDRVNRLLTALRDVQVE